MGDWLYNVQERMAKVLAIMEKPEPTKEDEDRWLDELLEDPDENLVVKFENLMEQLWFDKV